MEFFELVPGYEHTLPLGRPDGTFCDDPRAVYGDGFAERDLSNAPPMQIRMTGRPIGRTHLLYGVSAFLLMTPRLVQFLEGLGDFPHQVIPVHLVQDREDWRDHPPIDTTSFVACNLHRHLHIIDFARSELAPDPEYDDSRLMKKLVLVEGVTVPPLFRQDDWSGFTMPLIPRSTRDALLDAGFTGMLMFSLIGNRIRPCDIKPPLR